MPEVPIGLSGVAETLLIPLRVRAHESLREDPLLKDDKAAELIERLGSLRSRTEKLGLDEADRLAILLRNRQFDRYAREFLGVHQRAAVVHIGCGLDSRFDRVDDGTVEWFDLDLPEVIGLRRSLIGDERPRYHLVSSSVFENGWMDGVAALAPPSVLFMAEGVFMYCDQGEVQSLICTLLKRFPGSEMAFDAFSPFLVKMNNRRTRRSGMGTLYRWGLQTGEELENWGDGIRLLSEWFPLDEPEPRLGIYRWMRHLRFLRRTMGIYRYRLGSAPT
jgi:O-methyltransferase involved in polyketide biosynthesis